MNLLRRESGAKGYQSRLLTPEVLKSLAFSELENSAFSHFVKLRGSLFDRINRETFTNDSVDVEEE